MIRAIIVEGSPYLLHGLWSTHRHAELPRERGPAGRRRRRRRWAGLSPGLCRGRGRRRRLRASPGIRRRRRGHPAGPLVEPLRPLPLYLRRDLGPPVERLGRRGQEGARARVRRRARLGSDALLRHTAILLLLLLLQPAAVPTGRLLLHQTTAATAALPHLYELADHLLLRDQPGRPLLDQLQLAERLRVCCVRPTAAAAADRRVSRSAIVLLDLVQPLDHLLLCDLPRLPHLDQLQHLD